MAQRKAQPKRRRHSIGDRLEVLRKRKTLESLPLERLARLPSDLDGRMRKELAHATIKVPVVGGARLRREAVQEIPLDGP